MSRSIGPLVSEVPASLTPPEPYWFCHKEFFTRTLLPHSLCWPMTCWKAAYFTGLALFFSGLGVLQQQYRALDFFKDFFIQESTAWLAYITIIDPILILTATFFAHYRLDEVSSALANPADTVRRIAWPPSSEHSAETEHRVQGGTRSESSLMVLPGGVVSDSEEKKPEQALGSASTEVARPSINLPSIHEETISEENVSPRSLGRMYPPQSAVAELAVVIPAHRCQETIKRVLESYLQHVPAKQIFVINNEEGEITQDLRAHIRAQLREGDQIHVVDYLHGNKTDAQYIGAQLAKEAGYTFVLSADDDVELPQALNVSAVLQKLGEGCHAVALGIQPVAKSAHLSFWQRFWLSMQRIEYLLSAQHKLLEEEFGGGVLSPHGAILVARLDSFISVLREVDTGFHGEDWKIGVRFLWKDQRIAFFDQCLIPTYAPTSFAALAKQRAGSWDMTPYINLFTLVIAPLFKFRQDWRQNVVLKLTQLYVVHSLFSNLIRVPLFAIMGELPQFWPKFSLYLFFSTWMPVMIWNYGKLGRYHPELKTPGLSLLVFPFYKLLTQFFALFGLLKALLIWYPNWTKSKSIPEKEALGWIQLSELKRQSVDPEMGSGSAFSVDRANSRAGSLFSLRMGSSGGGSETKGSEYDNTLEVKLTPNQS